MGLLQPCGPPGPKAKDSIKGLDIGEEEPSFASNSETERKDAFLVRLGRGCSLLLLHTRQRQEVPLYCPFSPINLLYHEDSRGTPHANTSLLALCVVQMTSSYRNAGGAGIYSQEDRTVHYLRVKAQRGRSGLSQAGKAESDRGQTLGS